jgi:hypothetical protein
MNDPKEKLLNTAETSTYLRIKEGTLDVWRCTKRYDLPYVKIGRKVYYRLGDIQKFIESRVMNADEQTA